MSGHLEIADLRGANAGLRQQLADRDDLALKLGSDIRDLEMQATVFRSALHRIAHMSNIDSVVHSVAAEALEKCHAE
jgi:hypothetical protein